MTSGERMVWAAEFVRALAADPSNPRGAALSAFRAVNYMVDAKLDRRLHDDARVMLEDMLSTGANR